MPTRRTSADARDWVNRAVAAIEADQHRSADTHLWKLDIAALSRHRLLSQGRVDPSDRQPEAPAGALAVSLCAVQRPYPRGHAGGRGVLRLHRRVGSLFRPHDRRPVLSPSCRARPRPRRSRRSSIYGGHCHFVDDDRPPHLRRVGRTGGAAWRPFHGSVHLCRTRDRLARQQQYRRIHLRADAQRTSSGARPGSS